MEIIGVYNVLVLLSNQIINMGDSTTFKHTMYVDNETPQKWNKILNTPFKNPIE